MNNLRRFQSLCMFTACGLFLSSAMAQSARPFVPGSVAPGRLHDEIVPINVVPQPIEIRYAQFPTVAVYGQVAQPFVLRNVRISGNLASCGSFFYEELIGKSVNQHDITRLADCIAQYYREHGYPFTLVEVPQQSFAGGELELVIHEPFVSQVDFCNCSPCIQRALECYATKLKNLKPGCCGSLGASIDRVLMLANQMAGVQLKAEIMPDPAHVGGLKVCITSYFKQFGLDLAYDNYNVDWQGPHEYNGSVYANSLLFIGDRAVADVVTSTDVNELQYYGFQYDLPVGMSGTRIHAWFNYAENKPEFSLAGYDFRGDAYVGGLLVKYPFILSLPASLYGYIGARFTESDLTTLGREYGHENIRVAFLGASLDQCVWGGQSHGYLELSEGLHLLGGSQPVPFGDENFTKVEGELNYQHYIVNNFTFYLAGHGQYGFKPLSVSEQMGIGGRIWGRAYDWAEILGDSGIVGTLELRYDTKPCTLYCNNAQYFLGYDAGVTWLHNELNDNDRNQLSSVQGGVRLVFTQYFTGEFVLAKPLTRQVESQVLSGQDGNNTRAFFRIAAHL